MSKKQTRSALERHSLSDLYSEKNNGLKLFIETAWGCSELKVAPFLERVAKKSAVKNPIIFGFSEIRNDGSVSIKIPHRTGSALAARTSGKDDKGEK